MTLVSVERVQRIENVLYCSNCEEYYEGETYQEKNFYPVDNLVETLQEYSENDSFPVDFDFNAQFRACTGEDTRAQCPNCGWIDESYVGVQDAWKCLVDDIYYGYEDGAWECCDYRDAEEDGRMVEVYKEETEEETLLRTINEAEVAEQPKIEPVKLEYVAACDMCDSEWCCQVHNKHQHGHTVKTCYNYGMYD